MLIILFSFAFATLITINNNLFAACPSEKIDLRQQGHSMFHAFRHNQGALKNCYANTASSYYDALRRVENKYDTKICKETSSVMATTISARLEQYLESNNPYSEPNKVIKGGKFCETMEYLRDNGSCIIDNIEGKTPLVPGLPPSNFLLAGLEFIYKGYNEHRYLEEQKTISQKQKIHIELLAKTLPSDILDMINNMKKAEKKSEELFDYMMKNGKMADEKLSKEQELWDQKHDQLELDLKSLIARHNTYQETVSQYMQAIGGENKSIQKEFYKYVAPYIRQFDWGDKEINYRNNGLKQFFCSVQKIAPGIEKFSSEIEKILKFSTPYYFVQGWVDLFCGKKLLLKNKSLSCITEDKKSNFPTLIDNEFKKGTSALPIEIAYYPQFFKHGNDYDFTKAPENKTKITTTSHSSLIIGRKKEKDICYYLIRNSTFLNCKKEVHKDIECDSEDQWVNEETLFRNTKELSIYQQQQQK
ncbi:MAG: hypothetical protein HQK51_09720 [Oligoflexia bacterium]|nr:hypothetical protein [Oligoflexia bacterium]